MNRDTLAAPASQTLEVKHSRFLVNAAPAEAPALALAFLQAVADPAATHNCWAYRIGEEYRFSDDGEPAGSAGRPILAAIDAQGYDQVIVVVTRWFGGIKLGVGGLVRAYGGSAAECLRLAQRQPLVHLTEAQLHFRFEDTGAVHATLAHYDVEKCGERYEADGVHLQLRLPADRLAPLKDHLRDATRNRVRFFDR